MGRGRLRWRNFYDQGKLLLQRYNAEGEVLWTRTYEVGVKDHVDLLMRPKGQVLLVAARTLLMVDAKGELLHKKRLIPPHSGELTKAILVGPERLALAGWKRGQDGRGKHLWMGVLDLRTDRFVWQRIWAQKTLELIQGLYPLPGGKLRAVGKTRTSSGGQGLMLDLSARGKTLRRFALPPLPKGRFETVYALAPHPSGLLMASNQFSYQGRGNTSYGKTKLRIFSPAGELLEEQSVRGSDVLQPVSLQKGKNRYTLFFHQLTYFGPKGQGHALFSSFDPKLQLQWVQKYNWGENTRGRSLQSTQDGGYVWVGWFQPKPKKPHDLETEQLLLVKVGADGKARPPK